MPVSDEIINRLDRIIQLLELQTFVPEEQIKGCQHRNKTDASVMGEAPMSRYYCPDCGTYIRAERA